VLVVCVHVLSAARCMPKVRRDERATRSAQQVVPECGRTQKHRDGRGRGLEGEKAKAPYAPGAARLARPSAAHAAIIGVHSSAMRASLLVVVVSALVGGCSPDVPETVPVVVPEPIATEPNQVQTDVLRSESLNVIRERPVQAQTAEQCRQIAILEAQVRAALTRYTEQYPGVIRMRQEIARLRSELPADGTFCDEQLEQRSVQQ
jgi:hypothetical protein